MKLTERAQSYCQKNNLLKSGDKVVIGISAGKDSVALTHFLTTLRHDLGLEISLAHFNHKLRTCADRDEAFVRKLAQQWQLPVYVERSRQKTGALKGSLEENARNERFAFFIRLARRLKADSVALAHTEDDLAETVLMRFIRGSGMKGLAAMLPKRSIEKVNFIRPFLAVSTKEVLHHLKSHKIVFCQDPTNKQKKFFRNRVRLELLPLLEKKYNKNIKKTLTRLCENLALDYDYLASFATKAFAETLGSKSPRSLSLDTGKLKKHHPAIQKMILRLGIESLKGDTRRLDSVHIEELLDLIYWRPIGSIVHLPSGIEAAKKSTNIRLYLSKP